MKQKKRAVLTAGIFEQEARRQKSAIRKLAWSICFSLDIDPTQTTLSHYLPGQISRNLDYIIGWLTAYLLEHDALPQEITKEEARNQFLKHLCLHLPESKSGEFE